MTIERAIFDEISEADLAELVTAGAPEGPRLEYKRDTYGNTDGDKREALKDISSFANTQGGHLIIGIEEAKGIPTALRGLGIANVDQEILRLEQLVRSGIEPRILGVRTRAVPLAGGGHCLVMRIPHSLNSPHRVIAGGHNRFYLRNSGGVHEAGMEELRTMFTQGEELAIRARAFRDKQVAMIGAPRTDRRLVGDGRAILHVVPLAGLMGQVQIDLQEAIKHWTRVRPLGGSPADFRVNLDGLLVTRGGSLLHGFSQLFRSGAIESVRASVLREHAGARYLVIPSLEADVATTLPHLLAICQTLNVPPPFVVMLTLEGIGKAVVRTINPTFSDHVEPTFYEAVATVPEVVISDFGSDAAYQRALRPMFDALWNMGGFPISRTFNQQGDWDPTLVRL